MRKYRLTPEGFTIIEIMIVLTIAGLILLIVFLAVPALQRNARNSQRKADIASLLAAIDEYISNNNGPLPQVCSPASTSNQVTWGASPAVPAQANVSYYNQGCWSGFASGGAGSIKLYNVIEMGDQGPLNGSSSQDFADVVMRAQCSLSTPGAATVGSAKQVAVLYELETSSGFKPMCQNS